jgi:hypothetical protein
MSGRDEAGWDWAGVADGVVGARRGGSGSAGPAPRPGTRAPFTALDMAWKVVAQSSDSSFADHVLRLRMPSDLLSHSGRESLGTGCRKYALMHEF